MGNLEPTILYEDEDVLAVNKPAGLLVHGDGKSQGPTLVDWIREHYPTCIGVGESMRLSNGTLIDRPGIVHRLDRETSGVMVIAKHADAYAALKEEFQSRHAEKVYHAFVWGEIRHARGVIDRPIGRSRSDPRKRIATRGAAGTLREAVTEYAVLKRGEGITYVEARPKTGRTHQIRAHFLAINHPVVGDTLYAPRRGFALGFSRVALHARSIAFTAPSGKPLTVEAPYPDDFEAALRAFGGAR